MAKGPAFRDWNSARHEERLNGKPRKTYNGTGGPMVVPTYQLAPILQDWCRRWLMERTEEERRNGLVMGPVQWLAEQTKLPIRSISRIINEEVPHTNEENADLLLIAVGQEYLLATGDIRSYQNPNWSLEKWLAWKEEQGCV